MPVPELAFVAETGGTAGLSMMHVCHSEMARRAQARNPGYTAGPVSESLSIDSGLAAPPRPGMTATRIEENDCVP